MPPIENPADPAASEEAVKEEPQNPLSMSDEDFLKLNSPPAEEAVVEENPTPEAEAEKPPVVEEKPEEKSPVVVEPEKVPEAKSDEKKPEVVDPLGSKPEAKPEVVSVKEPTADEAQAFFKQVMAPFKANGKTIELKSPEEVIQLMQMGANYTRKLQDIQPHRKVLQMLQNNDLLDEGKLSYLIDLDKRDPEAIKKLIKDANIDPLEIDVDSEPKYAAGSHIVSDEESNFKAVLDVVITHEKGPETIKFINENFDQTSKEAIWAQPELMQILHDQRESGVFDIISTEIEKRRTLGQISINTPFLQAYQMVGDQLYKQSGTQDQTKQAPDATTTQTPAVQVEQKKEPEVVATRAAAPKNPVANGEQAQAAAPTKSTPAKAGDLPNPLAMSDEEFLKWKGRL